MINIVIPMAGAGSRFLSAGYINPKPLIDINGYPMIKLVIKNLTPSVPHRFIFICQRDHLEKYNLSAKLEVWSPGCEVIGIEGVTEGAACTVLMARKFINNQSHLMIANSDQYVDVSIDDYLRSAHRGSLDGLIMTMKANDPKWSYAGIDKGLVTHVVEKEVISDEATVGIYNFSAGKDFVNAADEMIKKDLRVNNEFYVAPVYNELIKSGKTYAVFNIGQDSDGMYGLGIPKDLEFFKQTEVCKTVSQGL